MHFMLLLLLPGWYVFSAALNGLHVLLVMREGARSFEAKHTLLVILCRVISGFSSLQDRQAEDDMLTIAVDKWKG